MASAQDRGVTEPTTFTALDSADYRRTPWKNGGGVSIDIGGELRAGVALAASDATLWRFGRTTIAEPGPFSDLSGFDRVQAVVAGRGLVLETPDGELDLREPFRPIGFDGATPITSRLEDGPVEVVNLIGDRRQVAIAMTVLGAGATALLQPGIHVIYAPNDDAAVEASGVRHAVASGHALQIDCGTELPLRGSAGTVLIGSVTKR